MRDVVNVIDNGALVHLVQSDNLDLLFANGRQTVLTQQVIDEALGADPRLFDRPTLENWIDENRANGRLIVDDQPISTIDRARYNPALPNGDIKSGQGGDIAIKRYIELNANDGKLYNVISNDGDLNTFDGRNTFDPKNQSASRVEGATYKGNFYNSDSTFGFINDLLHDKRIDPDTYLSAIKRLDEASNAAGVTPSHKVIYNREDTRIYFDNNDIPQDSFSQRLAEVPETNGSSPGFNKFYGTAALGLAVEAARQAGIIGDILSFGVTAANASEQLNNPELSEEEARSAANKIWVEYIFETAGGLAGAAIGIVGTSFALRGAGGFWAPILGAIAGGLLGSLKGAEAGAALYDAFPEIFDPVFDFVYDTIDELETLGNTSSEAFTLAILSSLGFDLTQTEGTDDNDWLIARGVGERNGGLGDDVILGLNAQFIAQGQQVDPDNPDSEIAQEDLRLTLDGGAGDDYVITLGGTGAITLGGEGRDFLFNTSFAGQIYGDTIDGQRNKDTITSDEFYDPDNPQENSDVFWFWPGTFIQDARPNDILQIFGLPLVGGSNSIAGIPAGDGGLAIDFFNWTTFYGTSNSGQLLVYNAIADLILNGANNSLGSIFGDGSGDILQSVQVVENYRFGGFSNEKFGRVAPGDLGLTFRIFLPRDRADEGITISLFNAAWGSVFTYIDVAFNLAKLLCFVFIPPQTSRKYCY